MIQIYSPGNRNFDFNGDYILHPISCELDMEINGVWEINLNNPIDENKDSIVENAVLSVNTPYGKKQLFIINEVIKTDVNIKATAIPIFFSNDGYLFDKRVVDKDGQEAISIILDGTDYTGHSDIKERNTSYYQEMNIVEALNANIENSFINRWGGEVIYNNFDIYVNRKIGIDNGMRAEFGLNITGISVSIDMSSVITRIRPKAYNGHMLPDNETVDSPNLNNYLPRRFSPVVIEYSDIKLIGDAQESDVENGSIVCKDLNELYKALRERAKKEFEINHVDIPKISYDISIADLSKTDLYKNFKELTKVNLGDIIHAKYKPLNIVTDSRVIGMKWDCVTESIISLSLGDYESNYFDNVSNVINAADKVINKDNNTLMADKIAGVINLLNTSLRAQKDIAQKQDVRAILFEDLDTNSPTFGALCIGTQGIQISKQRNETNTDWVWGTAINFESIIANYIITGILSDRLGKFYLNLDTGELRMKDGTFTGSITGGTINGSEISTDRDLTVGRYIHVLPDADDFSERQIDFTFSRIQAINDAGNPLIYFTIGNVSRLVASNTGVGITGKLNVVGDSSITGNFSSSGTGFFNKALTVGGDLNVVGSKNRVVDTKYGKVKMNAIESTYALFEDFGVSKINDKGISIIKIDKLFKETVSVDNEYLVLLQEYGEGHLFVVNRNKDSFIVKGTPNLKFGWRITAKQKGYENIRMEVLE